MLERAPRDRPGLHRLGDLSDDLYARTVRSIPAAFDPDRTDFGQGQGTRPYLWSESPRVLTNHRDTLNRIDVIARSIETR
ncbi:MAG: hypothetical protein HC923_12450 [Myxococcales bacterium]|nr:hypothetical protein [Myxococcales bacterium]